MAENTPEKNQEQNTGRKKSVQDLYSWKSLNRPDWSYSKEVFTTLGAVALLLSIIFAFFQEWLAILVIWAAFFLFYALSKVAPVEVEHKITTEGIVSMEKSYLWSELGPFWFVHKSGHSLLHVLHSNIFGQLVILIEKGDEDKIQDALAEYLPYVETPQKSTAEKLSDWFSKKFPIEKMMKKDFKAS